MDFTPQTNDIVIPIIGITGSGKSNFINTLVPGADLEVRDDIDPCTLKVQPAIVAHPNDSAYRVVFVDTPGLDSTESPDEVVLKQITDWLHQSYNKDMRLAGIIYLFEITQARVSASSVLTNLERFDRLCGAIATKNVILASTKWSLSGAQKGIREQDLTNIRAGSRVHRFEDTSDSAWGIVNLILAEAFTFDTEALQGQLRDPKRKGNKLHLITRLQASLQEQNRMAEQLKQAGGVQVGDDGLWDKLVKNEKDIRDSLAQLGIKVPITQRIKTFFLPNKH